MAMKNISFEEGYKSFTLNGDKKRVIRFNPADPNLMKRAKDAVNRIHQSKGKLDGINLKPDGTPEDETDETIRLLNEFDEMMRDQFNYIFNSDIYDLVFDGQSPMCIVGKDKVYLFEAFLDSVLPMMAEEIEAYNRASQERIDKYTKGS